MDAKAIGNRIRELRGRKSMQEVSEDVGISYSALSMYENGERIPRDEIKIRLATYFGTSVQALFYAEQVHET